MSSKSGEIIVKFWPGTDFESVIRDLGLELKDSFGEKSIGFYVLIAVPEGSEDEWIEAFQQRDDVKKAGRVIFHGLA